MCNVHQHDCSVLGVAVASGAADVPDGWLRPLVASPGATESTANGEGAEEQPEAPAADMDADSDFADCAAAAAAAAATMEASAVSADTASRASTSAQRDTPPPRQLWAANNTTAMFRQWVDGLVMATVCRLLLPASRGSGSVCRLLAGCPGIAPVWCTVRPEAERCAHRRLAHQRGPSLQHIVAGPGVGPCRSAMHGSQDRTPRLLGGVSSAAGGSPSPQSGLVSGASMPTGH